MEKKTTLEYLKELEAGAIAKIMSIGRTKKRPLYIRLTKKKVVKTEEINNNLIADYDKGGELIGLELL